MAGFCRIGAILYGSPEDTRPTHPEFGPVVGVTHWLENRRGFATPLGINGLAGLGIIFTSPARLNKKAGSSRMLPAIYDYVILRSAVHGVSDYGIAHSLPRVRQLNLLKL
jgi:hypothetical protein